MNCPACRTSQAKVMRRPDGSDRIDVECLSCATFSYAGPELPVLEGLLPAERERLSAELRAAYHARSPVYLAGGITRTILAQGWRAAR